MAAPTEAASTEAAPAADAPATDAQIKREVTIWTLEGGAGERDTLVENANVVSEINPFWYELNPDGTVRGSILDAALLTEMRGLGVRILPTIANAFDRERVLRVIGTPEARTEHVQFLLNLVLENDFDGLDVDYESLYAEDRENFTLFIEELADAFHAEGKLLSIAVHPKTDDNGTWGGPQAQDYARLGAAVDMFKVMTYDFSWSTSEAGPIAPVAWAHDVIAYATSQVPEEKVYLGIPFYAYDWLGAVGESKVWNQVSVLLGRHKPEVKRDESNEGHFVYGDYRPRTVYFADALSLQTKLDAIFADFPALGGISIWRLGGEDPASWDVLREFAEGRE